MTSPQDNRGVGQGAKVEAVNALVALARWGVEHAESVERDTNYDSPTFGPSSAERMREELERLHEPVADLYIALSGKRIHASDCATSNAPAYMPGECDCDYPQEPDRQLVERLAINLKGYAHFRGADPRDDDEEAALTAASELVANLALARTNRTNQVAELVEALAFYADVGKYPAPLTGGMGDLWTDCGQIARRALASHTGGQA